MKAKQNMLVMPVVVLFSWSCSTNADVDPNNIVKSYQKINEVEGNFTGSLSYWGLFGNTCSIGDIDKDGINDLAVAAHHDNDGGSKSGAVWILFMNTDGTVKGHQKISRTTGNLDGVVQSYDYFGTSLTSLGDLDGDGVVDLAVGAIEANNDTGYVLILFLNTDGTVKKYQKINNHEGDFSGMLDPYGRFGTSIASLGDFDKDGVVDIAVGSSLADDGGTDRGAIWILFLNVNGTVKSHKKISHTEGNFSGILENDDRFSVVTSIGDLDGDGITDIAVGAVNDDDGGRDRGALWIIFLNADATVKSYQKISDTEGEFTGILYDEDHLGNSIANMGDLDGDGYNDLAVGSLWSETGWNKGAVWLLFLNPDGTVKNYRKISEGTEGFDALLHDEDYFGYTGVASVGDLDGDGVCELAVAAQGDDDTQFNGGAVWILFLNDIRPMDPIDKILLFIDDSIANGRLQGKGPGKSAQGRLNALVSMIWTAGDFIDANSLSDACGQLSAALAKTDGLEPPSNAPDFVEGEAAEELANMIQELNVSLGCQ